MFSLLQLAGKSSQGTDERERVGFPSGFSTSLAVLIRYPVRESAPWLLLSVESLPGFFALRQVPSRGDNIGAVCCSTRNTKCCESPSQRACDKTWTKPHIIDRLSFRFLSLRQ